MGKREAFPSVSGPRDSDFFSECALAGSMERLRLRGLVYAVGGVPGPVQLRALLL